MLKRAWKRRIQSFIHVKHPSFIFQTSVSQVSLNDVIFWRMQLFCPFSVPLSPLFLDFIGVFLSLCCSGAHVSPWMFLSSSQNITPVDVNSSQMWYMHLNKEDIVVITLHFLFPSLITPPSFGWMASGCRNSCLMVFGVGGFSSGWCSLAGWCVTDSRRSLVPSPSYPAWFSRLTRISWRSITPIFDNPRYSWKSCGHHRSDRSKTWALLFL